jgi:hypothetical protein
MANSITRADQNTYRPDTRTTPENYTTLGSLISPTKPDNREILVRTYGDQGLTGFIELTGAKKNVATADEVTWWEEGRLHKTFAYTALTSAATGVLSGTNLHTALRLNDVLLLHDGQRVVITALTGASNIAVKSLTGSNTSVINSGTYNGAVIGNIYAQGTNQPATFYQTSVTSRTNPLFITKEVFIVNGSQATNIGWVNVDGSYLWYHKNEMDARKRFMNQREMMMVFGQKVSSGTIALETGSVPGTEGYFQAVETRGIVADVSGGAQGTFASMSDMDQIILELDKEGAPSEYAMYVDRRTSLDVDDMIANGIATQVTAGLPGQFGAFNNDANMAIQLGFKSFTRGGYTFHKHDWNMLNDATISGLNTSGPTYKGALIPMTNVADAKTGERSPALEMNYKGAGNYNRDVEHFITGSILGHATDGTDVARFNYRSECNLVTRAANQHVVLK